MKYLLQTLFGLVVSVTAVAESSWELEKNDKDLGIEVFTREV